MATPKRSERRSRPWEKRVHELQLEHDILVKASEIVKKRPRRQSADPEQSGEDPAG
jgi:hypothetical protein